MKKDVNRVLLYLLLVPLFLFAWFAGYYHSKVNSMDCVVNDNIHETVLEQKNSTYLKEKEILEQGYFDMRQEKEQVLQECSTSVSEASDLSFKFNLLSTQFKQVQDSLISANEQISSLIVRNDLLCEKIRSYGEEC